MKVLLDTNILIDAFTDREPFADSAGQVLLAAELKKIDGYITPNTLIDANYHLRHYFHNKQTAREYTKSLLKLLKIIDLVEVDCYQAHHSEMTDFEDAVLAFSASRHGIDHIITRNIKDFKNSPVPAITPQKFLKDYLEK